MPDMEWVDLAEELIDKGEWSKDLQRRFVAAVRLAEKLAHRAEYVASKHQDLRSRGLLDELVLRLRSGDVEGK